MFLERVWNVFASSVYQFIYLLIKLKYNKFKIKTMFRILLIFAFLFPSTLNALSFDGKFVQGHFIIGKTQPQTEIWIDKKKVKVTKDGYFAFGIGRDRKYDIIITTKKDGIKQRLGVQNSAEPYIDILYGEARDIDPNLDRFLQILPAIP